MRNEFTIGKKEARLLNKAKPILLDTIKTDSEYHFKEVNFKNEAFVDSTIQKWDDRKNHDPSRNLLVKTGNMRNSIESVVNSNDSVTARIPDDVPYAEFHQNGTEKIPQRKMIGDSEPLNDTIKDHLVKDLNKHVFK